MLMETAEIKNGRLAMLAITIYALEEAITKNPVVQQQCIPVHKSNALVARSRADSTNRPPRHRRDAARCSRAGQGAEPRFAKRPRPQVENGRIVPLNARRDACAQEEREV